MTAIPSRALFGAIIALTCTGLGAQGGGVLISRGQASLTVEDMDGRMSRIPAGDRAVFAHKPENLARLIDQTLLNRQLAIEAREAGIDKRPDVARDLELALEEVLAVHRLNALVEESPPPDFEQLAEERYRADSSSYARAPERIVEHVLISADTRSEDEARELAATVVGLARKAGADFPGLVSQYSDDPGKAQNGGRYTLSRPGQYVPEFERAAATLSKPGDVSDPVKTKYGYHVLRLVEIVPSTTRSFAEVKDELVAKARDDYANSLRESYNRRLRSQPENGNEELLVSLRRRYGGEIEPAAQTPE